jgi:hypothetical protein
MVAIKSLPFFLLVVLLLVVIGSFGYTAYAGSKVSEGPMPFVFPAMCPQCQMAVLDPAFAAEIITKKGKAEFFDDPGCLFEYLDRQANHPRAVWFHHRELDRWLPEDKVEFVQVPKSPMGYGIQAVDPGTPGSITLHEARELCRRGPGATARR